MELRFYNMTADVFNKIIFLKNNKKYDEAIELAKSAFRRTKDNCFNNEIYNCLNLQKKYEEAVKVLKKMIKYEPENISLLKKIAYNYYAAGNFKSALKYYKQIAEREPVNPDNHYSIGLMYHYLNDRKNAYNHYYNAICINSSYTAALNNIGLLYFEANDFNNAIIMFKKAISAAPSNPEAYHHLGIIQRVYKDDEELSELYLKKAIRLDPKYSDNYYQLALTYDKYGKQKDAITALKKSLELNPKNIKALQLSEQLKQKNVKNRR